MSYTVTVKREADGSWFAQVDDLPGCFASGFSIEELHEATEEAIGLYLSEPGAKVTVALGSFPSEMAASVRLTAELCTA